MAEGVVQTFGNNGPVWLLVCCLIGGAGIGIRAIWQWGFRDPDKNRQDLGGRITRVLDSHVALVEALTSELKSFKEMLKRVHDEGCGVQRADSQSLKSIQHREEEYGHGSGTG